MKIALIQPELDEAYKEQRQAYGSGTRPPETGLAVLAAWVKNYSNGAHKVTVLDPRKNLDSLAREAAEYDLFGATDWFSNHFNCFKLMEKAKRCNRNLITILGGPNASLVAREILNNHESVDYIASRDGEGALLALADRKGKLETPNLWYRDEDGKSKFSFQAFTHLPKMPLWDFSSFQNADKRLADYLAAQKVGLDPWLVPPLTIFSFRGCIKAMREGPCAYCTSSETAGRALPPEKLWKQVLHLNALYGAEIFYMADDIFTVSPAWIRSIAQAKPKDAKAKIRAYGYLPDLAKLKPSKLEGIAQDLAKIGVFNLFYGAENYHAPIVRTANKHAVSIEETERIIKTLREFGDIKATIAYVLGLPGESRESLELNERSFETLLNTDDCVERLYISPIMPLKGTELYRSLVSDALIQREYSQETRKNLEGDDYPDYSLLTELLIKHRTSVTAQEVNDLVVRMIKLGESRFGAHRVGGFMLK
jgi:radical SAM superfamily enzyme YgiQ (UPF0313 family)